MVKVFLETHSESMVKFSVTLTEKDALQKQVQQLRNEVNSHKTHIRSLRERVTALFHQNISTDAKVHCLMEIFRREKFRYSLKISLLPQNFRHTR